MKNTHLHTFLLIVLFGLLLYQSFHHHGAIRQARQLTYTLEAQLDSLQLISKNYQRIHETYMDVHQQLVLSQHHVTNLSTELARISTDQQADVTHIRDKLQQLLMEYDSLYIPPNVSTQETYFQP